MAIEADRSEIWLPESDPVYLSLSGVRAVDFVLAKPRKLAFVEFKTSAPHNAEAKNTYCREILEKYWHTGLFYLSKRHGRRELSELPEKVMNCDLAVTSILFILCVKNISLDHAHNLADELRFAMQSSFNSLGGRASVAVINERVGKNKGWLI